ncbi:MAG TPA: DUF2225 domain-containing protein [Spirochaetota bacterium]|nr:DUF2225 domain-containing protein [Spirochaetota bacterium]
MSEIEMLKQLGKLSKYSAGSFICYQGTAGDNMFIILKGKVAILINSQVTGDMLQVAELGSGEFVGEMSILEDMPRSATVKALEQTVVLVIERERFKQFINKQPGMAFKIMKSLSGRIRKLNEQLTYVDSDNLEVVEDKSASEDKSAAAEEATASIYLKGHKEFTAPISPPDKKYVYKKTIKCPLCYTEFEVYNIRLSRLRISEKKPDFREVYQGFNKLPYEIWTCPECLYSDYIPDFLTVSDKSKEKLYNELVNLKKKENINISREQKTMGTVFTSYYLTLFCKKVTRTIDFRIGKTWLHLAWLYEDVDEKELSKQAFKLARENYINVFYNSRMKLPPEEEWKLFMLLAELFKKEGNDQETLSYLQKAVMLRLKGRMGDEASDKLADFKEYLKKKKK